VPRTPSAQRLELAHNVRVTAKRQIGVNAQRARRGAPLLQPSDLALIEGFEDRVGQGRATPQRQRSRRQAAASAGRRCAGASPPSRTSGLKQVEVELAVFDPRAPACPRLDPLAPAVSSARRN
jgi:hypothetical protein